MKLFSTLATLGSGLLSIQAVGDNTPFSKGLLISDQTSHKSFPVPSSNQKIDEALAMKNWSNKKIRCSLCPESCDKSLRDKDVRECFRNVAREIHPDKNPENTNNALQACYIVFPAFALDENN